MSEIEFHTDEDWTEAVNDELAKSNSSRLEKKVTRILELASDIQDHVYKVKLDIHYNDSPLTSVRIKPKDGTRWWVEGENTTGKIHCVLGPRGGAKRLEYKCDFSNYEHDYSNDTGMWKKFFRKLKEMDTPKIEEKEEQNSNDDEDNDNNEDNTMEIIADTHDWDAFVQTAKRFEGDDVTIRYQSVQNTTVEREGELHVEEDDGLTTVHIRPSSEDNRVIWFGKVQNEDGRRVGGRARLIIDVPELPENDQDKSTEEGETDDVRAVTDGGDATPRPINEASEWTLSDSKELAEHMQKLRSIVSTSRVDKDRISFQWKGGHVSRSITHEMWELGRFRLLETGNNLVVFVREYDESGNDEENTDMDDNTDNDGEIMTDGGVDQEVERMDRELDYKMAALMAPPDAQYVMMCRSCRTCWVRKQDCKTTKSVRRGDSTCSKCDETIEMVVDSKQD